MNLVLSRADNTLSVDGAQECYVLESDPPIIPLGLYKVSLTVSNRAVKGELWSPSPQHVLPLIEAVPGHTGVRIHAGNTRQDTAGCVLVGRNRIGDTLVHSRDALTALMAKLQEPITLEVI
jgi:hypothetical protein